MHYFCITFRFTKDIDHLAPIPTLPLSKESEKTQQETPRIRHNLQQNNPELFTEIMKNLEELKNNEKIKEILNTTKTIKS